MMNTISGDGQSARSGNAPKGGITFDDMGYVAQYKDFLCMPTWEEAKTAFIKTQPEPKKMNELKVKQEQYVLEIEPLNQKSEQFVNIFENKEQQRENEFSVMKYIAEFKSSLLELLPEDYIAEGRRFLNNFIMCKNENNPFPGEYSKQDGMKEKIHKFLLKSKFDAFKAEFARLSADFNCFNPPFDVTASKQEVEAEINARYDYGAQREEYEKICAEISRITKEQEDLALAAGKERMSLAKKLEHLKLYYDKHLFAVQKYENIPFSSEKEKKLSGYADASKVWRNLMKFADGYGIHFSEAEGLLQNGTPVAAVYDASTNSFVCNKGFVDACQVFIIADSLLNMKERPLGGDYNVKSRYQYELCRRAEHVANMISLAEELALFLPDLKAAADNLYPRETAEFENGQNVAEKYARAFLAVFRIAERRKEAEDLLYQQLQEEAKIVISEREKEKIKSLSLGEITAPFIMRGAPMINDFPDIKQLLNQISLEAKARFQPFANKDNDYSLLDMSEFK